MIESTEQLEFAVSGDYAILLFIVVVVAFLIYAVVDGVRNDRLFSNLVKFVEKSITNEDATGELTRRFNTLSPDVQNHIRTVINVVSPITELTPGDLDDRTVDWLKGITGVAQAEKAIEAQAESTHTHG